MIEVKEFTTNCERRGHELLREAKEHHAKRKEAANKESYQSAKEGATYLKAKKIGRIMTFTDRSPVLTNVMSNADRRKKGIEQDPALPDFQQ